MVKLFTVAEMQLLEKEANSEGLSYEEMMENAGHSIANEIDIAYSHLPNKKVFSLIGSGNNGGDALVALSYLTKNHWETGAYIVCKRNSDDPLLGRVKDLNTRIIYFDQDREMSELRELIETYAVMMDGVFGTGIKLPLRGETLKVLDFVKNELLKQEQKLNVVAVDCPSGVDCDTGELAPETIPADMTITLAGIKNGLFQFPAAGLIGELKVGSIGSIEKLETYSSNHKIVLNSDFVKKNLPVRPNNSHKGTFGTAYIIAGSVNYTGAALLAGKAAYYTGTGLVTLAIPKPLHCALAGQLPESTWVLLPHVGGVISSKAVPVVNQSLSRATAILIGPGFGLENTTRDFVRGLLTSVRSRAIHPMDQYGKLGILNIQNTPVVIDADGLKLMSHIDHWPELLLPQAILTPHPGEMSVLTGLAIEEIQKNRIDIAKKYASIWGHTIVLKGAFTVIADPNGMIAIVPVATSALAKAGTGDVLAGIIVGLRAQGLDAFTAACTGAWIHANAGLVAAKNIGNTTSVMAGDVLNHIPQVISGLM